MREPGEEGMKDKINETHLNTNGHHTSPGESVPLVIVKRNRV